MFSQTLDQIKARLLDTYGGADTDIIERLVPTAWEDTIRAIDTERIGQKRTVRLNATGNRIRLPDDFFEFISVNGGSPRLNTKMISSKEYAVPSDGQYTVVYYGLDMDERGMPLVLDVAVPALLAMIDYMVYKYLFDSAMRVNGTQRSLSAGDIARFRAIAIDACAEARGQVNMLSFGEQIDTARRLRRQSGYSAVPMGGEEGALAPAGRSAYVVDRRELVAPTPAPVPAAPTTPVPAGGEDFGDLLLTYQLSKL